MIDYVPLIVCGSVFFVLGWKARELHAQRVVNKYLKEADKALTKDMEEHTMHVHIHKEHGCFYIYNSADDTFITQVKSKDEMFDFFKKHYPSKNVLMKNTDLALFDAA